MTGKENNIGHSQSMEREIVFRVVWNDMVSLNSFTIGDFWDHYVELQFIDDTMLPFGDIDWEEDKVRYEQRTGLTDKNGVRIFEGDILQLPKYYETPESSNNPYILSGPIIFEDGSWVFSDGGLLFDECDSYDNDIEVIGNIHENKELLTS